MANFWYLVNKVIADADILLLVLDSRFPEITRNKEVEQKVEFSKKKILYVLNKSDLVTDEEIKKLSRDYNPCVFVSCKERLGGTLLFKKIMELSRGEPCNIGVLGYPNVGKSSVINLLKGKKSAAVSSHAGHTKALQLIKAKGKVRMLDTPGVLPYEEKDKVKQIIVGSINPQELDNPEFYALKVIDLFPDIMEKYYGTKCKDSYEFLETVALKRNFLIKGGVPDTRRFSVNLLQDWVTGKMHEKLKNNS